ncbi:MAG: alanine--tRNA ligase [Planctomycetota bacterium]
MSTTNPTSTATWTGAAVRRSFIEHFEKLAGAPHAFVPSAPVVPLDDPTLLFINAGMNQFKPIFLGQVDPSSDFAQLRRAANSQKCIRAGGKHNDLEDVGRDTYHHTFFEMLGNWSFGDYFKAEAIQWAWDLLTTVWGLPADRMHATYFGGDAKLGLGPDEEARDLWLRHLPPERVLPFGHKDNFWEMGDTGPCGPCSELHFDRVGGRDASKLVNADDPDVIEIWNLVFIQYDRQNDGSLRELPARHVDTGMGLERVLSVLQDKPSNYDTDLFAPIFEAIQRTTGVRPYAGKLGAEDEGQIDFAYRVIADHARALTFAITDGAVPSNEGRGYVLRRILRRAVRMGWQKLGARPGFLGELVAVIVEHYGEAFPELKKSPDRVAGIIRDEEESFGRTMDRGIKLFEEIAGERGSMISGADAFQLYDTYGFPFDLTQVMAEERGLTVDEEGFEQAMAEQRERARAAAKGGDDDRLVLDGDAIAKLRHLHVNPTDDADKHHGREIRARVKAIWNGKNLDEHAQASDALRAVGVLLDKTNFYAEAGGQQPDEGRLFVTREISTTVRDAHHGGEFHVRDAQSFGGYVLHIGVVTRGELRVGDEVTCHVDANRRLRLAANHTATHLFNYGLREVIARDGQAPEQRGSLVAPDRLRFDFDASGPIKPDDLGAIEGLVRHAIEQDHAVHADLVKQDEALAINGLRAVFGEKYPNPVRVVSIGAAIDAMVADPDNERWRGFSVELCGGTHLARTSQAEAFAIVHEEGVAKGIRRVVAVTRDEATQAIEAADGLERDLAETAKLADDQLDAHVTRLGKAIDEGTLPVSRKAELRAQLGALQDRVKAARKAQAQRAATRAVEQATGLAESMGDGNPLVEAIEAMGDRGALQQACAAIRRQLPDSPVMLLSVDADGKVAILADVPQIAVDRGLKAGDWLREVAGILGGKGGGKPTQAQGGGPDAGRLDEAIERARTIAAAAIA